MIHHSNAVTHCYATWSKSTNHTAFALCLAYLLSSCTVAPPNDSLGHIFRDSLRDGTSAPEMVWLATGTFMMGDLHGDGGFDEKPVHRVAIREPFALSRYEITVGEFRQFAAATAYVTDAEKDDGCWFQGGKSWREPRFSQTENQPVVCVSWNDANAYVSWLGEQTGKSYRLPTEAEWEYAARAGTRTRYSWGDTPEPGRANCWGCLPDTEPHWTMPVGSFPPNPFGLHDMEGNVWEWTASEWNSTYTGDEERASRHDGVTGTRVIRSGGWFNGYPDIRTANRAGEPPMGRYNTAGIRIARSL